MPQCRYSPEALFIDDSELIPSSVRRTIENANTAQADVAEPGEGRNIIFPKKNRPALGVVSHSQPLPLLQLTVSLCCHNDKRTRRCLSIDVFADGLPDLGQPLHLFPIAQSSPQSDLCGGTASSDSVTHIPETLVIRSYRNAQSLYVKIPRLLVCADFLTWGQWRVNAYYIYIHPYLPLLPPPETHLFPDNSQGIALKSFEPDESSLPYWPESPLGLALMALLVLIPQSEDANPMRLAQLEVRKSYANKFVQAALRSISDCSASRGKFSRDPISTPRLDEASRSVLHADLPSSLEPVLALLLLGAYESCQNSDRRQMRSRVYDALVLAMDLSLHIRDPMAPEEDPTKARVWWMTVWPTMLRAQGALLQTGVMAKEMAEGSVRGSHDTIRKRVADLDRLILALTVDLDQPLKMVTCEGPDATAIRNLWLMARFLAHTARLKLHRFRAFGDHPVFLDKFCDLSSVTNLLFSELPVTASPGWLSEVASFHPFTEEDSTQVCLRSALVLSRVMRAISWPNVSQSDDVVGISSLSPYRVQYPRSLPYIACCGMQSCYVFMMLLRKIRTSVNSNDFSDSRYLLGWTEPGTERQAAERFIEELRHGVKSICAFMSANTVFGGIMDMAHEVETVYLTHFSD
ncbi:unnamed protein product [Penicillium salamii]|nr:unnamed protein product [Penicillium salamii]CAG8388994.1 unnamed protein product [Penicillium salamii]